MSEKPTATPRRFLFVSTFGQIADLAWQVIREGHDARMWVKSREEKEVGDGFVPKVADWKAHVDEADVVVFDDVGWGETCEALRAKGKRVIGGTRYADRLEEDRDFGQEEMATVGMTVLPSWDFTSFDAAIAFIAEHPDRYVVKPNGKAQNEKVLSYVGQDEDGKDVANMLTFFRRSWGQKIKAFQLQKHASGVEVAVGGFFDGKKFLLPACVNFEHKKLFDGEIGPSTGEMGTSMFWAGGIPLVQQTILRFEDRLAACGYTGYFDLNCIASPRGIVPLEATARFGYPTLAIQMDGVLTPWGDLLHALAGGDPAAFRTKRGFQVGVVVAVPPYPFEDAAAFRKYAEDATILWRKERTEGVHPGDVKLVDGDWRLTGVSGYALVVTGTASTMVDAKREAYGRVRNVVIPNMFYRTDISDRWIRDADLLQTWGLL